MRFPAIPREPSARLRLMSFWFAMVAVVLEFGELAVEKVASPPARVAGMVAVVLFGLWQVRGYRRRAFPEFSGPVDAVFLVAITAATSLPLRAMGVFIAAIQFRSLYATRRDFGLTLLSYGAARVIGLMLTPQPAPYGPGSSTVVFQFIGMLFIGGILFLLMLTLDRQEAAEAALVRSEERYRVLAAAAHDMVFEWDLASDAVTWSEALGTEFGFATSTEPRGHGWWMARVHDDDREQYAATVQSLRDSGRTVRSGIRYRINAGDGTQRSVLEIAVVRRDAAGDPVAIVSSVRDVTTERRMEEQLRDAQKMEAVGQLAGGIAHDFNNLLTVIGGHVFMLEQAPPTPQSTHHLGGITHTIERAGALTRQLLAFGRRQMLHPTVVDLNAVVRDAVRLIGPAVGASIRIDVSLDPAPVTVRADIGQLEQVLLNLAINARDAMPTGGLLRITTSVIDTTFGPQAQLVIRDNGAGMDAQTIPHVFEPFFTTKAAGKGTGLGLATTYGIIKQSSGDITVDSTAGKGTTFTITLPIVKRLPPVIAPLVTPVSISAPPVRRALLVEDDAGVREFAREVLIRAGVIVVTARDGAEGLAVARAEDFAFDIVVTDVVMPEMTGPQMVAHLRETRPDIRVLYVTGYADDAVTRETLRAGHEMLLEKPFSARALREAINSLSGMAPATAKVTAPAMSS